jgi:polyhydroxyalkanoate synthesis regulator protein
MGGYIERNLQLFQELQKKVQEQSAQLYGGNAKGGQEMWNQFMSFQGPAMQGLISTYMDQSRNMFLQMQDQLQNQTRNMFAGFNVPGMPGQTPPPGDGSQNKG